MKIAASKLISVMTDPMQILASLVAFGSAIFALHLFMARPMNRWPSLLLGATFFLLAHQTLLLILLLDETRLWAQAMRATAAMWLGPLVWIYFAAASDPRFRPAPRLAWHFAPSIIVAIQILVGVIVLPVWWMICASLGVYALAAYLKARNGVEQFQHLGSAKFDAQRWLFASAAILSIGVVAEVLIEWEISNGRVLADSNSLSATLILDLAVVTYLLVTALHRPSPIDWIYRYGQTSRLSNDDARRIVQEFEIALERGRLFADETVTLASVAKCLNLPARHLSEAINQIYGESFSRRMNRRRVEEAKMLLGSGPDRSITDIMFEAGFRTKSSFNKEFRAIVGFSPTEFRTACDEARLS